MYGIKGPLHAKPNREQAFGHDRFFIITEDLTSTEALPDGYHWRSVFAYETKILVVAQNGMPYDFATGAVVDDFIQLAKQGA